MGTESPQSCLTLCNPMDWGPPGSSAWDSPSKNTGVGCHALTQRIFLIQEFKPHLMSSALAGGFFTTRATWEAHSLCFETQNLHFSTENKT